MEVREAWWHRLIKVTIALQFVAMLILGVFLAYQYSFEWNRYFSWQSGWQDRQGSAVCEVKTYASIRQYSVHCGGIYSPRELGDRMVADGVISNFEQLRTLDQYSIAERLQDLLRENPSMAWQGAEFSGKRALYAALALLAALALNALFSFGAWRLLLYVVYGKNTRMK